MMCNVARPLPHIKKGTIMKVKFVLKHVICLLLVIALSLGFGGCERKDPGSAESVNAETSEAVTESTEGTAEITEATVDPTEVVSNEETTPGLAGTQTTEVDNQAADTVPHHNHNASRFHIHCKPYYSVSK